MIEFMIGLFIGGIVGLFTCALFAGRKRDDREDESNNDKEAKP